MLAFSSLFITSIDQTCSVACHSNTCSATVSTRQDGKRWQEDAVDRGGSAEYGTGRHVDVTTCLVYRLVSCSVGRFRMSPSGKFLRNQLAPLDDVGSDIGSNHSKTGRCRKPNVL